MTETVILVDYENVPKVDLGAIPQGARVPFFFGASQKSVPTDFLRSALKLGDRFVPIDVEGHGKNALDFYIAFYLGEYLANAPGANYLILSRDKGFDPLIKHLCRRGFNVRRASTLAEGFPPASSKPQAPSKPQAFAKPQPVSAKPQPTAENAKNKAAALAPFDDALHWLGGVPKNKRPRKRKGLVAHLYSHFAKKLTEQDIQALVDQLLADRKILESNNALTYNF